MSLISLKHQENSDLIAKDFAHVAADHMLAAQQQRPHDHALTLPLENLYRLLEMFKYDSFEDEPRSGVLALGGTEELSIRRLDVTHAHRFDRIIDALRSSCEAAYPQVSQADAIDQLQASLRDAAKGQALSAERSAKASQFFSHFHDAV